MFQSARVTGPQNCGRFSVKVWKFGIIWKRGKAHRSEEFWWQDQMVAE